MNTATEKNMYSDEEIRVAMARKNLSVAEVAEKSGVHRATVGQIRQGQLDNPQIKTLEQVANAVGLGMKIEFFPLDQEAAVAK